MRMHIDNAPAAMLTDEQIASEIERIGAIIDEGFGEHGGSPGEWYYERYGELELAQRGRASRLTATPLTHGG
jgi:hypothetical protein